MSWFDPIAIDEFIQQSNAIEGVSGPEAFVAHWEALDYIFSQDDLTLDVIKETHRILMTPEQAWSKDMRQRYVGEWRDCPVWVGGRMGEHYEVIPKELTRKVIEPTMSPTRDCKDWKQLHVEFERIHPFIDGNGRTGRLIMQWTRVNKSGGLPILVIHTGEEQEEYYKWFSVENRP